jgi:menaquinone-dependent protoporphyrinogen oxidase
MTILVVYASTHGHTGRIARRVADVLRREGLDTVVADVRAAPPATLEPFDAVIAGASVHRGKHQPELVAWAREHAAQLSDRPSAFFSVSLTAADDTGDARRVTRELIDELLDDTGWTPTVSAAFAGAFQYREYDIFTRTLMRLIARQHGVTTDTSKDVDLTDWDAVERFAASFAAFTRTAAVTVPASGPPAPQ